MHFESGSTVITDQNAELTFRSVSNAVTPSDKKERFVLTQSFEQLVEILAAFHFPGAREILHFSRAVFDCVSADASFLLSPPLPSFRLSLCSSSSVPVLPPFLLPMCV